MPLDAETIGFLEDVKKGKPRRFVLITKGETIVSLVVYKKGSVEKYKKEAKEEGKGELYFGVVDGKGQNISFKLCTADGFDKAPGKDSKLKAFLKDEADLKFKPVYEIVPELPKVSETDDDDVSKVPVPPPLPGAGTLPSGSAPPVPPPPSSKPSAPPVPPPQPQAGEDAERFRTELKALVPRLKEAISAGGNTAASLQTLVAQAQAFGKQGAFDRGLEVLDQLKELLDSTASGPEQEWRSRFARTEPRYLEALQGQPTTAQKLRVIMTYATEQAEAGEYTKALTALDRLDPLLDEALSGKSGKETDVIPEGIVASVVASLEKARQSWDVGIRDAMSELKKVQDGFRSDDKELVQALDGVLTGYQHELGQVLAAKGNLSSEEAAQQYIDEVRQQATDLKEEVLNDELLAFLDTYPGAAVKLQSAMESALSNVEKALSPA
jgi:hypothetical protein